MRQLHCVCLSVMANAIVCAYTLAGAGAEHHAILALLPLLDEQRPELSGVFKARDAGNLPRAETALLRALRERREPAWPERLRPPPSPSSRLHGWGEAVITRDLGQLGPHLPTLPASMDYRDAGDDAARQLLLRFDVVRWLARAYRDTGNPRYAREFVHLADAFITEATQAAGPAWDDATAAYRLRQWIEYSGAFLDAEEISPSFCARFFLSLHQHAALLAARNGQFRPGAEQVHEAAALALAAMLLPEFRAARDWLELAWARLEDQAKRGVNDDGFFPEISATTQLAALDAMNAVVQQALRLGQHVSSDFLNRLRPVFMVCFKLLKPDGSLEPINRSHVEHNICDRVLEPAARLFPGSSDEFLYACDAQANGQSGRPRPPFLSVHLPASGLAVMRNGWDRQATFCLFTATPHGPHHDIDYLQITLHARGVSFLIDPAHNTTAEGNHHQMRPDHSTVWLDGRPPAPCTPVWNEWLSLPLMDVADASHTGYPDAIHRRAVAFVRAHYLVISDRIHGAGQKVCDQAFHVGDATVEISHPAEPARLFAGGQALVVIPVGAHENLTWGHDASTPLIYRRRGSLPLAFATVLYPCDASEAPMLRLRPLPVNHIDAPAPSAEAVAFLLDTGDGRDFYLMQHAEGGTVSSGPVELRGRGAALRWNDHGRLIIYQAVELSHLTAESVPILSADGPVSVAWSQAEEEVKITGQAARRVRLYAPGAWSVRWNGAPASFQTEDAYIVCLR